MTAPSELRPPRQQRLRRELVVELVRKDLKVKYQGSALGFLWSLANPLLVLVVYTFVFQIVLKSNVPYFGIFLLTGLLIWNFFSMSVGGAATSIIANAGLVKKVPFPRTALPISAVGFAGAQVALQYLVLLVALIAIGKAPIHLAALLVVPAVLVATVMTVGLSMLVAALTVRYRDTQHLLEVIIFGWFWLTPIVYPGSLVLELTHGGPGFWAYFLNPLSGVVVAMQRALYGTVYYPDEPTKLLMPSADDAFYLEVLGVGLVVSLLVFALGAWVFNRWQDDFAENL